MSDTLTRFLFEDGGIRGEVVRLGAAWQAVQERRPYPPPVRDLLGEALAAALLMTATLKMRGRLGLQLQGPGPVRLVLAQATSARTVRGLARWEGELPAHRRLEALLGRGGHVAITLEPEGMERYQGLVPAQGAGLAEALEGYFRRSEQLPTRLWLAADGEVAAGLLLQQIPGREVRDADQWGRLEALAGTVTRAELLRLEAAELVRRLFHEEDVRLFEPEPVSFRCGCSRERVAQVLWGLGRAEVEALLAAEGAVTVDCEFCGRRYRFDAVDVEALLVGAVPPPAAPQ